MFDCYVVYILRWREVGHHVFGRGICTLLQLERTEITFAMSKQSQDSDNVAKKRSYGDEEETKDAEEEAVETTTRKRRELRPDHPVKGDFKTYYKDEMGEEPQKKADSKVYPRVADGSEKGDREYECMEMQDEFAVMGKFYNRLLGLKQMKEVKGKHSEMHNFVNENGSE